MEDWSIFTSPGLGRGGGCSEKITKNHALQNSTGGIFRLCSNQLLKRMKWTSTITSTSHQLQEVTVPSIYEIYRTTLHLS